MSQSVPTVWAAAVEHVSPTAVRLAGVMAEAIAREPDVTLMEALTAHVYAVVATAIAMSPDDPVRWMARLEAAGLALRKIGSDVHAAHAERAQVSR